MTRSDAKNVGEWSEVFALGQLLSKGGADSADETLGRIQNSFVRTSAVKIPGGDNGTDLIYFSAGGNVRIQVDGSDTAVVSSSDLASKSKALFEKLVANPSGRAFRSTEGEALLRALRKSSVATSSTSRHDLLVKFGDSRSSSRWTPLSIKSKLGGQPTLLNASGSTNFLFEIKSSSGSSSVPRFGQSLKTDMRSLFGQGKVIQYQGMDSSQFEANLRKIDPKLPSLLGKCLLETTKHRKSSFDFIVPSTFAGDRRTHETNTKTIKKFLGYVARGLTPSAKWDGRSDDFGGILYVVPEGDVLLFTARNVNALEDYLFNNLKFEYGSRDRHGFGTPFARDGRIFIKLNLQIRFK